MPLGEDAAIGARDGNPQRPAIFESQRDRRTNQRTQIRGSVDGSLDPVQAGNRQPRSLDDALIARNPVADLADDVAIGCQIPNAGALLDELHHLVHILP